MLKEYSSKGLFTRYNLTNIGEQKKRKAIRYKDQGHGGVAFFSFIFNSNIYIKIQYPNDTFVKDVSAT